jgi:polar amino acid transport system substrate-binding protein
MYNRSLLFIGILLFAHSLHGQTIRIASGDWDPYLSSKAFEYGLTSHIITEAFKLEGIDIQWGFFPWKRTFESAKEGEQWDASAAWWPSERYKKDFYTSDAIMSTSLVFFHLKDYEFHWDSVDDLSGINIGVTRGYHYGESLENTDKEKKLLIENANSDEQNFAKLLFGRIDIFPNDVVVGYTQINNTFSPNEASRFTHHPKKFKVDTLHLLISKRAKNAKLFLQKFNAGLKKIKASPQYQNMLDAATQGRYNRPNRLDDSSAKALN